MTEVASFPHGTPSWCDLSTTDLEGATRFYSELFGWEAGEPAGPEAGGYTMFSLGGRPVAALARLMDRQQEQGVRPAWTTYVSVDDVDALSERVAGLGGTLVAPPFDVMAFGRMCVVTDPSGASVALWQAREHAGAGVVNEPGSMCWNELTTRDPDAATAFYAELLDWEVVPTGEGPGAYRELRRRGEARSVAGCLPMEGGAWPDWLAAHWTVYFAAADTDEVAARAVELGGTVSVAPTDIAPGRFAVLGDREGATFAVIAMRPGLAEG